MNEVQNEVTGVLLKCKSSTDATKLAGSIYNTFEKHSTERISIRVIGAGALNQATKAVIISNRYVAQKGLRVVIDPSFEELGEYTAIELKLLFVKI